MNPLFSQRETKGAFVGQRSSLTGRFSFLLILLFEFPREPEVDPKVWWKKGPAEKRKIREKQKHRSILRRSTNVPKGGKREKSVPPILWKVPPPSRE